MSKMSHGYLFYLVGPSGAGKDSLINYAREHISEGNKKVVFAHRYITRAPVLQGENHVYLSEREYDKRLQDGLFAMHWKSHDYAYAIGIEINAWLAKGMNVVVNGSRAYLHTALTLYQQMRIIEVSVSNDVLRQRLTLRNRETPEQIVQRLNRQILITECPNKFVIENNGLLEEAGNRLLDFIIDNNASTQCA